VKYISSFVILSLFSVALSAAGLSGLDANKFRWAETYLDSYKKTSGNSKDLNKMKVENYIKDIQGELDSNKGDPEHAKYKARLGKLIAGLNEDASGGVPENIGDAKSNLYWAKGKIDYALEDKTYGATEANLQSADGYLKIAKDILFSGKYQEATGEYKELIDLYAKLRGDLDKIHSSSVVPTATSGSAQQAKNKKAVSTAGSNQQDENATLVKILTGYRERLEPLIARARSDSMNMYNAAEEGNLDEIRVATSKLSDSVEAANSESYPISRLMKQINDRYPDLKALGNQGQSGLDAAFLIPEVNRMLEKWNKIRVENAGEYLRGCESDLMTANGQIQQLKMLPVQARGPISKQYAGSLRSSKSLLNIIPTLLPVPPKGMGARTQEMEALVQKSFSLKDQYGQVEKQFINVSAEAGKELQRELEASRFPKGLSENSSDEKEIRVAFGKVFSGIEIERFAIKSDWKEKRETRWVKNVLTTEVYKYISAWIAHKLDSGKHRVYNMSFRKILNSDGSWSKLEHWSVGYSFEILENNLNK